MKRITVDQTGAVIEEVEVQLTIQQQIEVLEASITTRRLRDAVLTEEGKAWLSGVEAQIAQLRGQL